MAIAAPHAAYIHVKDFRKKDGWRADKPEAGKLPVFVYAKPLRRYRTDARRRDGERLYSVTSRVLKVEFFVRGAQSLLRVERGVLETGESLFRAERVIDRITN